MLNIRLRKRRVKWKEFNADITIVNKIKQFEKLHNLTKQKTKVKVSAASNNTVHKQCNCFKV